MGNVDDRDGSGGGISRNADWLAIRNYVTAGDAAKLQNLPDGLLLLDLTHSNLKQRHIEIRFQTRDPLSALRERIYQKTGTPVSFQHLQVMESNQVILEIPPSTQDHLKLGYFGIEHHGMRIHCVDLNPHSQSAGGAFENVNLVKKYVMTDEEYDQRPGTVRAWKRQQKEKGDDSDKGTKPGISTAAQSSLTKGGDCCAKDAAAADSAAASDEHGLDSVHGINVSDRCQVTPGQRRGRVAWKGQLDDLPGWWVGVVMDEPVGSNDGSWKGRQLFATPGSKYGSFVRGKNIETGAFPERDIFDESDDDDDDEDEL